MIGEIRDQETAQMAIEASLTGHLVLSTLHTNSAPETVTRLLDMGMDPFNFGDSLLAVLAQRLIRRLCGECRVREPMSQELLEELLDDYLHPYPVDCRPDRQALRQEWLQRFGNGGGELMHAHAPGCAHCNGTGLAGRIGVHELMVVTPELRRLIQTGAEPGQLTREALANAGMHTLRQDGIEKVLAGLTSLQEVRANSN
jgi:type II secretory ATPase GspE/PulE/Tfp pilus assembly ATPase PilB-like protein